MLNKIKEKIGLSYSGILIVLIILGIVVFMFYDEMSKGAKQTFMILYTLQMVCGLFYPLVFSKKIENGIGVYLIISTIIFAILLFKVL